VVAGGGAGHVPEAALARDELRDGISRAGDLERRQPEALRLVLDEQLADAQRGGEMGQPMERRRPRVRQSRVKRAYGVEVDGGEERRRGSIAVAQPDVDRHPVYTLRQNTAAIL
jgi:hypothetical protein